jgi:hypothetical protein
LGDRTIADPDKISLPGNTCFSTSALQILAAKKIPVALPDLLELLRLIFRWSRFAGLPPAGRDGPVSHNFLFID